MPLVTAPNTEAPLTHASTQSSSKSWSQLSLNNQNLLGLCLIHFSNLRWMVLAVQCPGYQTSRPSAPVLGYQLIFIIGNVSRYGKAREGVQALPGQSAQPEQHLRPAMCLHQYVLWTPCQGETLLLIQSLDASSLLEGPHRSWGRHGPDGSLLQEKCQGDISDSPLKVTLKSQSM